MTWQMKTLTIVLMVVCCYFWGNINWAVVISKIKGRDIRTLGSGNPGTMNMLRTYGKIVGAITLIAEIAKGVVPALLGWWILGDGEFFKLGADRLGLYIAGVSTVVGHNFPVLNKFKGGKGAANTIGVCLVAQPVVTIITFAVGVGILFLTGVGSIVSFIMMFVPLGFEGYHAAVYSPLAGCILVFVLFMLTLLAHVPNIKKLFGGVEGRVRLLHNKVYSEKEGI